MLSFKGKKELYRSASGTAAHGGVLAAFVDISAHAALHAHTDRGMPTIDLRIDYLRPAEFPLTAKATPQRVGRTLGTADVEIRSSNGAVSALGRVVFLTRAPEN